MPAEPVRIVDSIDQMLADVSEREVLVASDGKSGNVLERVLIGGERRVVKRMSLEGDWIMRVMGDRVFWPFLAARAGLFDRVPACIDHAVVAVAQDGDGLTGELAFLMHDVGAQLIPEGDAVVTDAQHRGFVEHMAAMHAAYWGWRDDIGLQTMALRLLPFAPATIAPELARPEVAGPIQVAAEGWARLPAVAPAMAELVVRAARRSGPAGRRPGHDARDVPARRLEDGQPGLASRGAHDPARLGLPRGGPPLWDLMWYLALNRARLPDSKEHVDRHLPRRASRQPASTRGRGGIVSSGSRRWR